VLLHFTLVHVPKPHRRVKTDTDHLALEFITTNTARGSSSTPLELAVAWINEVERNIAEGGGEEEEF